MHTWGGGGACVRGEGPVYNSLREGRCVKKSKRISVVHSTCFLIAALWLLCFRVFTATPLMVYGMCHTLRRCCTIKHNWQLRIPLRIR